MPVLSSRGWDGLYPLSDTAKRICKEPRIQRFWAFVHQKSLHPGLLCKALGFPMASVTQQTGELTQQFCD